MTSLSPSAEAGRVRTVRLLSAGAAAVTAVLYLMIGFGVLEVGKTTTEGTQDPFAFGTLLGGVYAVTAVLLARFSSRVLWIGVAVLQLIVIVGYFALANIRIPAIETNGLLVKAAQGVVLASMGWLLLRGGSTAPTHEIRTRR